MWRYEFSDRLDLSILCADVKVSRCAGFAKADETILSTGWADLTGLAWSSQGEEVWFTGNRNNGSSAVFAVTLTGKLREVTRIAGDLLLFDVGRDGRVLLGREDWRGGIYALPPGESRERDLSWFDFSLNTLA